MRVLLICDEHYHPGQVAIDGVAPLKEKGYEFDIIKNGRELRLESLADYPVVLLNKSDEASPEDRGSWKTNEVQQAFINYVEGGGGLLVIHGGTVPGKDTQALDKLIGSKFVYHPNAVPVTVEPVKPHPITEGVEMFCEEDEHYHLEFLGTDADILIAAYAPAQGQKEKYQEDPYHNAPQKIAPCGYVRTQGKGRVCVLTPGHNLSVWLNPNFQRTLNNALRWCAG